MPIIAKQTSDRVLCPEGIHRAICIGIYDLGTQTDPLYGAKHKVLFRFELCDETSGDGVPLTISRKFNVNLSEKGSLRPFLQSWRGRAFTKDELDSFDVLNVLGAPCQAQIVHEARDGKTYDILAAAMKLMKGMQVPQAHHAVNSYSMDRDGKTLPADLPEWIARLIQDSAEWKHGFGDANRNADPGMPAPSGAAPNPDADDSGIPF